MLSKEYALAFYQYGNDLEKVEVLEKEFGTLIEAINDEPEFMSMLSHPKLSNQEKKDIVHKVMKDFDSDLLHFCYVLIDNGRFEALVEIYEQFVMLIKENQNIMVVHAKAGKELTEQHIADLTNMLELKYKKKIEIITLVDESVLGGVRLEFNGKVLDATLKTNLDDLKSNLI